MLSRPPGFRCKHHLTTLLKSSRSVLQAAAPRRGVRQSLAERVGVGRLTRTASGVAARRRQGRRSMHRCLRLGWTQADRAEARTRLVAGARLIDEIDGRQYKNNMCARPSGPTTKGRGAAPAGWSRTLALRRSPLERATPCSWMQPVFSSGGMGMQPLGTGRKPEGQVHRCRLIIIQVVGTCSAPIQSVKLAGVGQRGAERHLLALAGWAMNDCDSSSRDCPWPGVVQCSGNSSMQPTWPPHRQRGAGGRYARSILLVVPLDPVMPN